MSLLAVLIYVTAATAQGLPAAPPVEPPGSSPTSSEQPAPSAPTQLPTEVPTELPTEVPTEVPPDSGAVSTDVAPKETQAAAVPVATPTPAATSDDDDDDDDSNDDDDDLSAGFHTAFAFELGFIRLGGNQIYSSGTGGAVNFAIRRGRWDLEYTLAGYAMRTPDNLATETTGGNAGFSSLTLSRRYPRFVVGAGLAVVGAPILAANTQGFGEITVEAVASVGPVVAGRFALIDTKHVSVFVGARLIAPLVTEVPRNHYVPAGPATTDPTMVTTTPVMITAVYEPGITFIASLGAQLTF